MRRSNVLRAFLLAAALCALCPLAAFGVDADGSGQGAVVGVGSSGDQQAPPKPAKPDVFANPEIEDSASEYPEDQGKAEALEAAGNEINDGQVSDAAFLYDAAIADLAGADSYYDGQTVRVTGEAVGEAMRAAGEDRKWVTLRDPATGSTVVVSMRASDAEKIDLYGSYQTVGAFLQVQGEYHLSCTEHEGESDIHATSVRVMEQGYAVPETFDSFAFMPGIILIMAGALLSVVYWRVRERSR